MDVTDDLDGLVESLREMGRSSALEVWRHLKTEDTIEWEGADFIAAAAPFLREVAERQDELGERARRLLDQDYPATKDDLFGD